MTMPASRTPPPVLSLPDSARWQVPNNYPEPNRRSALRGGVAIFDCSGVDNDTHAIADQLAGGFRGWCTPVSRCNSGLQSLINGAPQSVSCGPGGSRQRRLSRAGFFPFPLLHHAPAVAAKAGNYSIAAYSRARLFVNGSRQPLIVDA